MQYFHNRSVLFIVASNWFINISTLMQSGDKIEYSEREMGKTWAEIGYGLFSQIVKLAKSYADDLIRKQELKFLKRLTIIAFFLTGMLFVLNGIAIFLNEYFQVGNWTGYVLVGLLLSVAGLISQKSNSRD